MAAKFKKISVSLPIDLIDDLDLVSSAFRVTRSALLTQLLVESVHGLKSIAEQHVLPFGDIDDDQTQRAVASTLDRLATQISTARTAYVKSSKH